jgi:outer membrane protein
MVLAAGMAVPLPAQQSLTVSPVPGSQERGAKLGAPEMKLTLHDAVAISLAHNINLEVSRLSLALTQQDILGATGIFDPTLSGDLSQSFSSSPATNQLVGATVAETRRRTFDATLGQFLATGTSYSVGWTNARSKTNSSFYFLNPSYDSGLTLSLSQALLQGFGTDVNRTKIEVARRNTDISQLQFENTVIGILSAVQDAYWNLVYARENLDVKRESLKLAQDLLDQTRTRVRIGTSAPIDIVQSEATVAAREQDIIIAENAVEAAADNLKQLLGFENPADWSSEIIPVDALESRPEPVDLQAALEQALKRRVEIKEQELTQDISRLNLIAARNGVLPTLDLGITYGYTGVAGSAPPAAGIPPTLLGSWDQALKQIWDRDYKQWSAGLNFSYPIGNHQAKAQLAQARFGLTQAQQQLALQRQTVIADVRQAVRQLQAEVKNIAAATKARELAERNLDAEQKKFANGMSTNYQVLQIQADLTAAQVTELLAKVGYREARVAYEVAIGGLLDSMDVTLNEPTPINEPHTALKDVGWLQYGHWISEGRPAPAATPQPAAVEPKGQGGE